MFAHDRLLALFNILNKGDTKVSCKSLSQKMNVTERTIRTDIASINDALQKHGAIIKLKRGEGYYIDILDLPKYQEYLASNSENIMHSSAIPNSPLNRNKYVLKYLLYNNDYIKLDDLADELYVSKLTILNDIKRIKNILSKYELCLISKPYHGIKIDGLESNKRKCISDNIIERNFDDYIIGFTKREKKIFDSIDLDELQDMISNEINKSNIEFSDFNLKNFMIHIAILISRLLNDNILKSEDNKNNISISNPIIDNICNYIENKYKVHITAKDKQYILNHYDAKCNFSGSDIDKRIVNYTNELLQILYDTYNFDLRNDNILSHDLQIHFKSILNSKYLNQNKINPLINTIKTNYPLSYQITFTSMQKLFKNSIYTFSEDEIGYVSLHIGAAMERFFEANITNKNIVLVCGSGYGTSRLLEAQINKVFHSKINISECLSLNQFKTKNLKDIDLIISTIPIKHDKIPVVIVDFTLLNKDIQNISKAITNKSIISDKILNEYFDKNLFLLSPDVNNKQELLDLMCDNLIKNEIVFPSFKESVLYRESLSSTNLDDFIAIPHPMELSASRTKLCVAILEKSVLWNENSSVRFVVMLAINKNDYFYMDTIYNILTKIISDTAMQNKLSSCKSYSNFMSLISKEL